MRLSLWIFLFLLLSFPCSARPCACCANPGEWGETHRQIPAEGSPLKLFNNQMKQFELVGSVFSLEHSKGSEILDRGYDVRAKYGDKIWTFFVTDGSKHDYRPVFALQLSHEYTEFKVDQGIKSDTGQVELYKELRFSGLLTRITSGIPIQEHSTATLVLQGRGNNCFNVADLNHWIFHFKVEEGAATEWAGADGTIDPVGVE